MNEAQLRDRNLKTYMGVVTVFATTLAVSWSYWYGVSFEPRFLLGAAFFAILILAVDVFPIRVAERVTIGTWDVALIFAVAALGPFRAALAAYETGHTATIAYPAGMVLSFVSEPLISGGPKPLVPALYGTLISGVTLLGANKILNGGLLEIKHDQSPRALERDHEAVSPLGPRLHPDDGYRGSGAAAVRADSGRDSRRGFHRESGAGGDGKLGSVAPRAFLRILDTENEGYRMADDPRFVFPDPETLGIPVGEPSNEKPTLAKDDKESFRSAKVGLR